MQGSASYTPFVLSNINPNDTVLRLHSFSLSNAATQSDKKLPVIVFLHGESFEWNSGNPYDGTVLASYSDLVVVTLNYRLGILGKFPPPAFPVFKNSNTRPTFLRLERSKLEPLTFAPANLKSSSPTKKQCCRHSFINHA